MKQKTKVIALVLVLLLALALLPAAALADETPEYAWTISPESLTFTVYEGYEGAPNQDITAVSTGSTELDFIMAGGDATAYEMLHITVGGMGATISPKPGLPVGAHTATVVISDWEDRVPETEIPVTIIVKEGPAPYPTLSELKITTPPTKVDYREGESFDYEGMVLTAVYSDGSEKDVTQDMGAIVVHDPLTAADTQVTFTYTDGNNYTREAVQPITVALDTDRPSAAYTDVVPTAWYRPAVDFAIENRLMQGVAADQFAPDVPLTRAMLVTILLRLDGTSTMGGENPFTDVPEGQWYSDAVIWASANGIVTGYGNGLFGPMDLITREQLAAILYRYASFRGYDVSAAENNNLIYYADAADVSDWAKKAMQWAVGSFLIQGDDKNNLLPAKGATRAETAAILMRFCELEPVPAGEDAAESVAIALEEYYRDAYPDVVEAVKPTVVKVYTAEEIAANEALKDYDIKEGDIVFEVTYDLKVYDGVEDLTPFTGASGEIDGLWVRNKANVGIVRENGSIDAFGTGW